MVRRRFLCGIPALPLVLTAQSEGPSAPPVEAAVEKMIPRAETTIGLCHFGFRPHTGRKTLVVRSIGPDRPKSFDLYSLDGAAIEVTRPLSEVKSDLGTALVADFSDLDRPGHYQISVGGRRRRQKEFSDKPVHDYEIIVGGERSAPFFIGDDVWRRTLAKAFNYIHAQRCGVEVPGIHPACHLDDGKRDDTGAHVDAEGGWHDAGDLWKGTDYTALMAVAMCRWIRDMPPRCQPELNRQELLDEVRWGNRYFLKMQDSDGKIWSGVGDQSVWTDNIVGTADDRRIITAKLPGASATFATLQALIYQCYRGSDAAYAEACLAAGVRAWRTLKQPLSTQNLARWTLAACELYRATKGAAYRDKALDLGRELLARQNTSFIAGQKLIRGFWTDNHRPYVQLVDAGLPPLALLELHRTLTDSPERTAWKDAVELHLNEYLLPMSERNAYRILPAGLYIGAPTSETYRHLAGGLTYRYFMPVREQYWWLGTTSHLLSNTAMLGTFAQLSATGARQCVDLAYRQMEWIMGANPFGASLMTGQGIRNPVPFSVFVGGIPGGILNGIGGNVDDEPVLNLAPEMDWRTCEYWSPHTAYYLWANVALEAAT